MLKDICSIKEELKSLQLAVADQRPSSKEMPVDEANAVDISIDGLPGPPEMTSVSEDDDDPEIPDLAGDTGGAHHISTESGSSDNVGEDVEMSPRRSYSDVVRTAQAGLTTVQRPKRIRPQVQKRNHRTRQTNDVIIGTGTRGGVRAAYRGGEKTRNS